MEFNREMFVTPEARLLKAAGAAALHISDIITYKKCRRAWNWSSPLRNNLERKKPYMPFFAGSALHYMIAQHDEHGQDYITSLRDFLHKELPQITDSFKSLEWIVLRGEIAAQVRLVKSMMEEYLWYCRNTDVDDGLVYLASEIDFAVPVPMPYDLQIDGKLVQHSNQFYYSGTVDGLVWNSRTGEYWLLEHKTCRSLEERAQLLINDPQATAYLWAMGEIMGVPLAGIYYNLIRKKEPTVPNTLKNGTLSTRKDMDTSPRIFNRTVYRNHGVEAPESRYASFYDDLVTTPSKFVRRVPVRRTASQLTQFARDLYAIGSEMTDRTQAIYPNETWACPSCLFREPCATMFLGADYETQLANDYRQKEHNHERV